MRTTRAARDGPAPGRSREAYGSIPTLPAPGSDTSATDRAAAEGDRPHASARVWAGCAGPRETWRSWRVLRRFVHLDPFVELDLGLAGSCPAAGLAAPTEGLRALAVFVFLGADLAAAGPEQELRLGVRRQL